MPEGAARRLDAQGDAKRPKRPRGYEGRASRVVPFARSHSPSASRPLSVYLGVSVADVFHLTISDRVMVGVPFLNVLP
jgi:hypothetical protein